MVFAVIFAVCVLFAGGCGPAPPPPPPQEEKLPRYWAISGPALGPQCVVGHWSRLNPTMGSNVMCVAVGGVPGEGGTFCDTAIKIVPTGGC